MPHFWGSEARFKDVLDQNMKFKCYLQKIIFAETEKQFLQVVKTSFQFVLLPTYFENSFAWVENVQKFCVMFEECCSSHNVMLRMLYNVYIHEIKWG